MAERETWTINYAWANRASSAVVWHGPDGVRRIINMDVARKYGLNPSLDDDWPCPGQEENDRRKAEFRAKKPGRVAVRDFENHGGDWVPSDSL